ncbi:MAG TPA: hypothetical protein VND23_01650 [Acidimicrobiales bacterium]|nr:hypothetical protein [Acidimicrobiales bacterium]
MTTSPVELIRSPKLTDRAPYAYAAVVRDASRLVFHGGRLPPRRSGRHRGRS